jgi:YbbR domain-containing protein
MKKTKYIFRLIAFLLAAFLLVFINRKTHDTTESVAEFKIKMLQKIQTDSLDSKDKLDLVVSETTKFVDGSSRVRLGTRYLTLLFVIVVVAEGVFFVLARDSRSRIN